MDSHQNSNPNSFILTPEVELRHLCVSGTSEASVVAVVAGRVLQAEACLVSLSHTGVRAGVQQVIMAEFVHAVVVPVDTQTKENVSVGIIIL